MVKHGLKPINGKGGGGQQQQQQQHTHTHKTHAKAEKKILFFPGARRDEIM
jgi:6-phosphogluconolactonase (cycloisomerase 2 family)